MTENEAIRRLKCIRLYMEINDRHSDSKFLDEDYEANAMAIKALEKQIPKKPDCIEDKMWCCPVCGNNLMHKWIKYTTKLTPKSEGLPYCMSCGQAIDWSE